MIPVHALMIPVHVDARVHAHATCSWSVHLSPQVHIAAAAVARPLAPVASAVSNSFSVGGRALVAAADTAVVARGLMYTSLRQTSSDVAAAVLGDSAGAIVAEGMDTVVAVQSTISSVICQGVGLLLQADRTAFANNLVYVSIGQPSCPSPLAPRPPPCPRPVHPSYTGAVARSRYRYCTLHSPCCAPHAHAHAQVGFRRGSSEVVRRRFGSAAAAMTADSLDNLTAHGVSQTAANLPLSSVGWALSACSPDVQPRRILEIPEVSDVPGGRARKVRRRHHPRALSVRQESSDRAHKSRPIERIRVVR